MADILTTKLKNDVTRMFYQDILDNEFFFAVSSTVIGELNRVQSVNAVYSKNEFQENIVFGKRVFEDDVKFMIKYYPWQKDAVYTQYDSTVDLESANFYSVPSNSYLYASMISSARSFLNPFKLFICGRSANLLWN